MMRERAGDALRELQMITVIYWEKQFQLLNEMRALDSHRLTIKITGRSVRGEKGSRRTTTNWPVRRARLVRRRKSQFWLFP